MNPVREARLAVLRKHRNDLSGCCTCPERVEWTKWAEHVENELTKAEAKATLQFIDELSQRVEEGKAEAATDTERVPEGWENGPPEGLDSKGRPL